MTARIHPKPWDASKRIGPYASITQAARELQMTRQAVKEMFHGVDRMETDQSAFEGAAR